MGTERELAERVGDPAICLAFTVLGKRWNGVIISVLDSGPASFVVLRRAVTGISDTVLSERLAELCEGGLVQRSVLEGPPVAVRYELTHGGSELGPILKRLGAWAETNLTSPAVTKGK